MNVRVPDENRHHCDPRAYSGAAELLTQECIQNPSGEQGDPHAAEQVRSDTSNRSQESRGRELTLLVIENRKQRCRKRKWKFGEQQRRQEIHFVARKAEQRNQECISSRKKESAQQIHTDNVQNRKQEPGSSQPQANGDRITGP